MTPEQKAAHFRLKSLLPVRKHECRIAQEMKGGRKYISPELIDEWMELRKIGKTFVEIAALYVMSKTTVGHHCRKREGK